MYYITQKTYDSKTFTDYTHSISEIFNSMFINHMIITNFLEYENDISGAFEYLNGTGFPLSLIIEAKKMIM